MTTLSKWKVLFPNEHSYTPLVGILGLGGSYASYLKDSPSILEQMSEKGIIASKFCGFHIGSAPLNQPGSMVLGGYEKNRVLGDVGMFDLGTSDTIPTAGPRASHLDVVPDFETGPSPFNESKGISLWHHLNDDPPLDPSRRGININPSVPYMYLPKGICEGAAQYLALTWNEGLALYRWDIGNESFRIISSSAYMAFVLADKNFKNITIK
ncbi:MAG: hypothetical protein Q9226_008816, partial [Calogaya cf. arnoldii]